MKAGLGAKPDKAVAIALGVTVQAVHDTRRRLGIERFGGPAPTPATTLRRYLKAGMGKVIDRIVAERLGVTKETVCMLRATYGIPAVGGRRR